jgi:short-subunit dehydrogenase
VRSALGEAAARLGGIDVLVNNAGIGDAVDAAADPEGTVREVLDVNLLGPWTVTAAAMPFLARSHGQVVNVSSGLAWATVPWAAAYAASKRGLSAWSDTLRMEHAGSALAEVTTVYPGYIRTPIHDRPAARGVSLEGLVPAVSLEHAVDTIVDAVVNRPREVTTGGASGLGIRFARVAPGVAEAVVRWRFHRSRRGQPQPAFVRSFDAEDRTVVVQDPERVGSA